MSALTYMTATRSRVVALTLSVCFVVLVLVAVGYRVAYADRIFPNTFVGTVEVGGLGKDVAREKIATRLKTLNENGLAILGSDFDQQFSVQEIGLELDVERTLEAAWSRGRKGGFGVILGSFFTPWRKVVIDPALQVNENSLRGEIIDLSSLEDDPPRDVRLEIEGTRVRALYDTKSGQALNQEQLAKDIMARLRGLDTRPVAATTVEQTPVIDPATAPAAVAEAERMLAKSLVFTDRGQRFEATPNNIGSWITSRADGRRLVPSVEKSAVSEYVATVASAVNVLPQNLGVRVEGEKVVDFIAPRPGRVVKEEEVIESILHELEERILGNASVAEIVLPVVTKEANTEGDAADLGITELIGRATTPFTGSPANRIANIKNGTRFLTGHIIKPGEQFSTVGALGTIDNTTGYLPELVIKGSRTIPEFGGGLCQVSTTLFRSVLNAGLPVVARQNHSYRVTYYEKDGDGKTIGPGLDATIYQPNPDFKFLNDTAHSILISGYVVGDRLTFELYGTKDGRVASVDGPKLLSSTPAGEPIYVETDTLKPGEKRQIEKAHAGGTAIATYNVTYADGTAKEQVFKSAYRSWPAQFLVGVEPKPEGEVVPTIVDPAAPPA